jgi:hypothetical protein
VVFSGDAAFSGQPSEYERAKADFFEPIMNAVKLQADRLFMVPGNHDFDRVILKDFLPVGLQNALAKDQEVQLWLTDPK